MSALFDTYLVIDWSAANGPKLGKDSIWIGETRRSGNRLVTKPPKNIATRSAAMAELTTRINLEYAAGRRVFAGFDFAFGYPAGAAQILVGAAHWAALWQTLHHEIEDSDDNRSNRFDLAAAWNRTRFAHAQFWGHPHQHTYDGLAPTKPAHDAFGALEYRIVERWQPPAKSVWQLAYSGAVGAQAMLGIARLQALRDALGPACAIWPFETDWERAMDRPIMVAEVYPSMFEPRFREGDVKDAAQVRTVASHFARLDNEGRLAMMLSRPDGLSDNDNDKVLNEEGWIVGAGHKEE